MKTVLLFGEQPPPAELRDLIARGSTSLDERRVSEERDPAADVDRVVFWAGGEDPQLVAAARRLAAREKAQRREMLVFVASDPSTLPAADVLAPNECYVWPRDLDRLEMAFLTGA